MREGVGGEGGCNHLLPLEERVDEVLVLADAALERQVDGLERNPQEVDERRELVRLFTVAPDSSASTTTAAAPTSLAGTGGGAAGGGGGRVGGEAEDLPGEALVQRDERARGVRVELLERRRHVGEGRQAVLVDVAVAQARLRPCVPNGLGERGGGGSKYRRAGEMGQGSRAPNGEMRRGSRVPNGEMGGGVQPPS